MPVYGNNEALKPGMALEADISLESRRLIEWVFDPFYRLAINRSAVSASAAKAR